ncbi:SusC/RagA family TonB-linked outer membrane protein [Pedobacter zeae]|uniref:SusC/RagA family TonB-linked outer membrane protein n=1 Tax=Pedobacter zeae TaxID=1737356 RepID=A0A7W6P3S7_9SPHI|nr:SusC/RagA family TonB-linked outer membrane protein [Pedobacter zeae]MBB4106058.1 TonB-linked SusC/RagA family outer membrane protein [Pedobacter zeae]GGH19425.1 SusC/RagA family TonB-linked outer membrane protein [Pedobacter zeae]
MSGAQRIIFLIGLISSLCAKAQTKVTLNFTDASFEKVIEAIQRQTVYHFAYGESKILQHQVSVKVEKEEAIKVIGQLLLHSGYTYTVLPNNLIVIRKNTEVKTGSDSVRFLKEVVITALGIEKDNRKVGYALTTIKGSSIAKARESNMMMMLQGRVAGLNIAGINGGPGSAARILIRGVSSMTAASPLFIVNGVPIDNSIRGSANEYGGADYGDGISNINPDDIETITILKGSAASALYGARAANGVILINLKSGGENGKPKLEYNTNLTFDVPVNSTGFQYLYGQGAQNKRPADLSNAISTGLLSWGEIMDGRLTAQVDGSMRPYSPVKNNIQTFYRTAPAFINTLSVVGGNTRNNYRVSVSNLDYSSILTNGALNRKTLNLYGMVALSPKLSLSFTGNYIYERNKNKSYLSDGPLNANYGISALATSLDQSMLAPGFDAQTGFETRWNADEYKTNPYFLMNKQADYANRNRYITSAVLNYKLASWASLQGRIGYDSSKDEVVSILPTGIAFSINRQGGMNAYDQNQTSELNSDILFSASRNLSDKWNLEFSAGANYRERRGNSVKLKGSQFKVPYLYIPENLVTSTKTMAISKIVTESAYYTADVSYQRYLNFSVTGRYDIYSTLPANNRGIFVPGVSGSFIFSDLLNLKDLDFGKLRLDFAKTSGEPIVPYTTQIYYTVDNQVNGTPVGGFSGDLPNYNLKPFTLNEIEAGLDLKFFNSRIDIDFTYFNRTTRNEIINAKQSVTTGFTSAYVNLGETRNAGMELAIGYTPILTATSKWKVNFNLTKVKNTLLSIDGNSNYTLTGTYRPLNANTALVVGKPITQIMAYDYLHDANGNVVIGSDGIPKRGNFIPMGGTMPTLYGGITNSFNYGQFSFSFLIDYRFGNKILSATEYYSYVLGLNQATLPGRETGIVANGVMENGQKNTINVPAYAYYPELATNISALSVLNGSFIKVRQATIGYAFNERFLKRTPFSGVEIDLVARNLFTLLKYTKNIDPESQFSPTLGYAGIEGASLPATRMFGINFNFKFR